MATINDVAQAARVSAAAVSRVLNKDDRISVSPEVRARIFQAAHTLGYVSPRQRRAAQHKTHLTIGVADWRIIRPDRPNVRLSSLSCLVQMMTDQYEVAFVRLTFGQPQTVDGVIAFGVFSAAELDFLRTLSFAIVFVNSDQHNYEFDQVQVDFDRGLEEMAAYLLDQKRYTGIGYIGGVYDGKNGKIGLHRVAGLRRVLERRGIYDPRTFHLGEISRDSGYELAKKAARENALAEAMLLGSDQVAEGALEAFRERGFRVPKDVAVIIYQDLQTLESKWPTGTCIEMFPDYVWENALELLFSRIHQRRVQAVTVTVPTRIKIGDTA
ncbi:substrate-binding domain-containing protein [Allofournierella sp.]|uniref:substrate-binding domain-containing protein n=1 Tax=Allofournierella sp. TaxID=1940256 RepID=UPI003AB6641A